MDVEIYERNKLKVKLEKWTFEWTLKSSILIAKLKAKFANLNFEWTLKSANVNSNLDYSTNTNYLLKTTSTFLHTCSFKKATLNCMILA
jgi:hypothetical protein